MQPFLSQLGLLFFFSIALKMNELCSTSTGLASSTLPLTLIQVVRAPHSHATTVHGDCKITVQFSRGFFLLNRVIAKTRKVRSRITRDACIPPTLTLSPWWQCDCCLSVRRYSLPVSLDRRSALNDLPASLRGNHSDSNSDASLPRVS